MGVYITIEGQFPCPQCGKLLSEWQCKDLSYDGYPVFIGMQTYVLNKKMSGEMHTTCETCGTWAEYGIDKGKIGPIQERVADASIINLDFLNDRKK